MMMATRLHISRSKADLACLDLLLRASPDWVYYTNQASSALPLKPVEQMEGLLSEVLRGESLTNSRPMPESKVGRLTHRHILANR